MSQAHSCKKLKITATTPTIFSCKRCSYCTKIQLVTTKRNWFYIKKRTNVILFCKIKKKIVVLRSVYILNKLYEYPFHYLLLLYKLSLRIDLVRWAKKWSEVGVENFSVWVPTYFVGASLKVFSLRTTNFLSEAGAVLTFFAYFFVLRQKSKWGFRGKAPVVLKSKALGNLSDNHIFLMFVTWNLSAEQAGSL